MKGGFSRGMSIAQLERHDGSIEEIENYNYSDGDEEFESGLQEDIKLKRDQYLKIHLTDIRAMRAFRNAIPSIRHANPENLSVYFMGPDRELGATRAFQKGDKVPSFHILTDTKQSADILRRKSGIENIFKGKAGKRLAERVEIVAVMDKDIVPTKKTLKNVEAGGWFLVPVDKANVARAQGYTFMGIIDRNKAHPSVRREGKDFWKKREVETDEELRGAEREENVVTYEEAARAVEKAYGSMKNVVEKYKRLIEMAKEQHPEAFARGVSELACTTERDGEPVEVIVKLTLPLKEIGHSTDNLAIFRKKLNR